MKKFSQIVRGFVAAVMFNLVFPLFNASASQIAFETIDENGFDVARAHSVSPRLVFATAQSILLSSQSSEEEKRNAQLNITILAVQRAFPPALDHLWNSRGTSLDRAQLSKKFLLLSAHPLAYGGLCEHVLKMERKDKQFELVLKKTIEEDRERDKIQARLQYGIALAFAVIDRGEGQKKREDSFRCAWELLTSLVLDPLKWHVGFVGIQEDNGGPSDYLYWGYRLLAYSLVHYGEKKLIKEFLLDLNKHTNDEFPYTKSRISQIKILMYFMTEIKI